MNVWTAVITAKENNMESTINGMAMKSTMGGVAIHEAVIDLCSMIDKRGGKKKK